MVVLGIDAHKRSHTVVAVDDIGRKLGERTLGTTTADHLVMLTWAEQFGADRLWAVEDCRHLSRRLERDLLGAGERIARVPPKLMAHVRDSARSYGKSDPIDALAVARAALREPNLPTAALDGPAREVRLLANHRDDLVAERTRVINRLRWHLHELDPSWQPLARSLWRPKRHCCVHRWGARAGCADASSSLWAASAEVKLRWFSVPAGGDHGGCAVVLALWALLP
jgi:transposase